MKILVTGATGFVGSHLCEKLVKEGHKVFALARNEEKFKKFGVPGKLIKGSLEYKSRNLWVNDLPDDLDAVVHTAGIVHTFNIKNFYDTNSKATKRLVKDLKERYKKLKFTFISSHSVAGPSDNFLPVDEESSPQPVSHYGHSKYLGEISLYEVAPKTWDINIIRPTMVIGPRDSGILDIFKMVNSGLVILAGIDGKIKRYTFVCIFDLVDVIVKSLSYKKIGTSNIEIFYAGHPKTLTYRDLINKVQYCLNKNNVIFLSLPIFVIRIFAWVLLMLKKVIPSVDFRLTPDKVSEIKPQAWVCSSKKSRELLHVSYQWDLDQTLAETFKDYKKRSWI